MFNATGSNSSARSFTNFVPPFVPDFGIPSFFRTGGLTALAVLMLVGAITGIIIGAALLADLFFLATVGPFTTAVFGMLGTGVLIISVIQIAVSFGVFGVRRYAYSGAIIVSVVELLFSIVAIIFGIYLIVRPVSLGGVSDFTSDPVIAGPLYALIGWSVVFGVIFGITTIAFMTRRHVRAIFGKLRPQDIFPGFRGQPFPGAFPPQFGPGGFNPALPPGMPPPFFQQPQR